MRKYNETCFLTGLPVYENDPVKALFLVPDGSDKDDPSGRWKPAMLPLSGMYDGRGGLSGIVPDAGMLSVLRGLKFKLADPKDRPGILVDERLLDRDGLEKTMGTMLGYAADNRLYVLIYRPNARNPEWMPIQVIMAHEWAWTRLASANRQYDADVKGNKKLERAMAGTLRPVVRHACDEGADMSVRMAVTDLASAMAGMGALGLTFHPMGHEDNRSAGWKAGFYEQVFLHAASDGHRDDPSWLCRLESRLDGLLAAMEAIEG